jgi:hypothetical protein
MSKTDTMETHAISSGEAKPIAKTPRTDQRDIQPEDHEWFRYVTSLSPQGENGAFLTPDELLDMNLAYDRLHSSNGGTLRKPSDGKTVADDEFIKKQMSTAFRRAFEMVNRQQHDSPSEDEDTLLSVAVASQTLRNAVLYNISEGRDPLEGVERSPTALQLARRYLSMVAYAPPSFLQGIKVLNYVRGTITGEFVVLLPQGKTHRVEFRNERGWKADIEFGTGNDEETKTIYARGVCMNVVAGTAYKLQHGLEFDESKIIFESDEKVKPWWQFSQAT